MSLMRFIGRVRRCNLKVHASSTCICKRPRPGYRTPLPPSNSRRYFRSYWARLSVNGCSGESEDVTELVPASPPASRCNLPPMTRQRSKLCSPRVDHQSKNDTRAAVSAEISLCYEKHEAGPPASGKVRHCFLESLQPPVRHT